MTSTYQAWQVHPIAASNNEYSPDVLQNLNIREVEKPSPGPGQSLVRIQAVALNYRDLLITAFSPKYPTTTTPGLSPCADGAGIVEVVGLGSKWKPGDEVIIRPVASWENGDVSSFDGVSLGAGDEQGLLQQYRLIDEKWLLSKPKHLTWEGAAALPSAGGTAVNALFYSGVSNGLELKGKTVLTQGTGGVSCATVQFAAAAGARVIATTSSVEKFELLKNLGAQDVINYKSHPNWAEEVLKLTNGRGVDLVVDVAGAGTVEQSLQASRLGGTVILVGFMTETKASDLVLPIIFGAKTIKGIIVASSEMYWQMVDLVDEHKIVPFIGKVFEWTEARSAWKALMDGSVAGKIVIKV